MKSSIRKGFRVLMRGDKPKDSTENSAVAVSPAPLSSQTAIHDQSLTSTIVEPAYHGTIYISSPFSNNGTTAVGIINPAEGTVTVGHVPSESNSSTALAVPLPPSPSPSTFSLVSQESIFSLVAFDASPNVSETSGELSPFNGSAFPSDESKSTADLAIPSNPSLAIAALSALDGCQSPEEGNYNTLVVGFPLSPASPFSPSVTSDAEGMEDVYNGSPPSELDIYETDLTADLLPLSHCLSPSSHDGRITDFDSDYLTIPLPPSPAASFISLCSSDEIFDIGAFFGTPTPPERSRKVSRMAQQASGSIPTPPPCETSTSKDPIRADGTMGKVSFERTVTWGMHEEKKIGWFAEDGRNDRGGRSHEAFVSYFAAIFEKPSR
jgi:hypothetical protein